MTVLPILKYPHPILREACQMVDQFDEELIDFVNDMIETLYHHQGAVGLAACQVGKPLRIFIMDMTAASTCDELKVLVNPVIVQKSRNKVMREGCLSFPDYLANVKRATKLTVDCMDQYGRPQQFEAKGLEAICIQHEIDHLDGVLMIDRIASLKTDWIRRHGPKPDMQEPPSE